MSMLTPTSLFDALKAEKSAQQDKEVIQSNNPHYKDATQAPEKGKFKNKAGAASDAT
jgi:hypothetical protein